MRINLLGLGKMGIGIANNLLKHDYEVLAYDISEANRHELEANGGHFTNELKDLQTSDRDIYWLMLPAGEVTNQMVESLLELAKEDDIIIEAGNSYYQDTIKNYQKANLKGVSFYDIGTSGGVSGANNGACMMIGGDKENFHAYIEPIVADLCVEKGYLYTGTAGSGHYLKMVHNGIEYGMMQSIAEGFNLLRHCDYDYDLEASARVFNHGSVIRSWLMELTEDILSENQTLDSIEGKVDSSGEGKWTVMEAIRLELNLPVITQSLFTRYASKDDEQYTEKLIASMRNKFGGHKLHSEEE